MLHSQDYTDESYSTCTANYSKAGIQNHNSVQSVAYRGGRKGRTTLGGNQKGSGKSGGDKEGIRILTSQDFWGAAKLQSGPGADTPHYTTECNPLTLTYRRIV